VPAAARDQPGDQVPMVLDLTIAMPGQVVVRGRGLTSEWQGRLKVTGPVDAPRLNGTLTVRRGEFLLLDRRLELRKGEILFTGARPPVPELEIEAFVQTADITAVIRLSGTLDDLHLELESEPSLPEDEILAYLLFGQSSDQLTAAQAVQLAAAVHRLTSGEAGLLERFRAGIGLDLLDVGVGATPEDRKVRAGKRVGDRIYLEVEQGEAQRSGRAKVEVDILPGVSIEADTGEDERTGVGVRWRYDY
jgi:translocation and assembly module TamB